LNWDLKISIWIRENLPTVSIRKYLGKVNRGEVFFILIIPFLWFSETFVPFGWALAYLCIAAFLNDRFVLLLKKSISRGRPLISVAGKVDSNPDMKYSFPSAHSANSMVVVWLLVFAFSFSPWVFIFTILSGVGRLLSLHHYFSDVVGGWVVGAIFGSIAVLGWIYIDSQLL
jgi:membrane-associated phospholipid phosphatase